ncbi:TetR/AcrR family transcriptional regulator [Rugosimonospora acidiphila]|uniref:TetR/AcrR family transcriptional regulator n=1 Tax=Rugosimonospora acidiphila TaxID=556531 RepID=A0ABP9SSG4_9ACTN
MLQVANELFYWHGIRATGVDRVAAEAGIAPTTLYRLFASKDDLIAAYIERAKAFYQEWFDASARSGGDVPRDQILAVFDAIAEQVGPEQCRGCPFLMALAEFPDANHPAHRASVAHKSWLRMRFGELVRDFAETTPVTDPEQLADYLALVMEGVYASVQALGDGGPARNARALAQRLLEPAMA